ncbi:Retrovirus-related Pol polyprotein from type-1 retrotransposable element R1 [Araneus ventricosus]|uniref:Retrovirus-related Pol polyprotein from type-1 retrotransposable element R1 n=1 Tax=Araneus ventricosus TaxID=182803 RepID=A0A4Y2V7P2_ARAVE|nr:Retrovirus-related Pol polyprotein from type-1 retrotransposable element R1 [Araneus ventricosus]
MTRRLVYHLESNSLISDRQFGFREGKSVDSALDSLITTINTNRSKSKHTLVLSIDIKGAFDNIQYNNIISLLHKNNCPANITNIFTNLLSNRQVLMQTSEGTALRKQNQGCPQGSCSGPAVWNLVANEVLIQQWPNNVAIQAFADDFVLVIHTPTKQKMEEDTETAINIFDNWARTHSLQVSVDKTTYMLFSPLVASTRIRWNTNRVKKSHSIKYLGVHIDNKLNWNTHLYHQSKKAAAYLQNLQKIAGNTWGLSLSLRRILYKTVVERMLSHGAAIWCSNPTTRTKSSRLVTLQPHQINLTDGGPFQKPFSIFTDGSKTDNGVGAAFCVFNSDSIIHQWSAKLADYNSVYQAELIAAKEAVIYAAAIEEPIEIVIHIDNQASLHAISNPKSTSPIARQVFSILQERPNIKLTWIKAHVGYPGNETADALAKGATENGLPYPNVDTPKSHFKSLLRKQMLDKWQTEWTRGKTGRPIHNIHPKVKLRLTDWSREDFLFFTGHGPFAHSLHRFRLVPSPFCACGKEGTPLHYITECVLTESWHLTRPADNLKDLWFQRVAGNPLSRLKIRQAIQHMHANQDLFKPDPDTPAVSHHP